MASRRSAQRLLADLARAAGPGALAPGLAVAALLGAAGCGGSSSSTSSESSSASSTEARTTTAPKGSPSNQAKAKQGSEGSSASTKRAPKVRIPEGSEREPGITPKRKAGNTLASVSMESPSFVKPDGYHVALRRSATCEGKNVPPTLRWKGLPDGTKELVLFAMSFAPVEGRIFFNWAVGGLDPSLTEIKDGKLPPGAILGRNSFGKPGYSICPPKGRGESYVFYLFALPKPLNPKPGFDPTKLREEALAEHANSGFLAVTYHVY